jgi:hypothetical protein
MERIAIGRRRGGARHEAAARAARAGMRGGPPGRGDFSVSNFHPDLIPGNLA